MSWKNEKSIIYSTPQGVIRTFIIQFNKPETDTSVRVGSPQKSLGILTSWLSNSIAATQGSRDSGGKGSICRSFFFLSCDWMRSSTDGLGMGLTTVGSQSIGGGVSLCAILTRPLLDLFLVCLWFLVVCEYAAQEFCG